MDAKNSRLCKMTSSYEIFANKKAQELEGLTELDWLEISRSPTIW